MTAIAERDQSADPFAVATSLKTMLAGLHKSAQLSEDNGERRVARRVLEALFIQYFEQGNDRLSRNEYVEAARSFALAGEIEPDRSGIFYYLAQAYALKGDRRHAIESLRRAIDNHFTDVEAITSNHAFDSLHADPQYQELL